MKNSSLKTYFIEDNISYVSAYEISFLKAGSTKISFVGIGTLKISVVKISSLKDNSIKVCVLKIGLTEIRP